MKDSRSAPPGDVAGRPARARPRPGPGAARPKADRAGADGKGRLASLRVQSGLPLPAWDWASELRAVPTAWPFLGPTWLRATERALGGQARPWHTLASRGPEEVAFLPGFIFDRPAAIDFDPRSYLGWKPPSGESACGVASGELEASAEVNALGETAFFPTLLLGSPIGYRTEVAATFSTPDLPDRLLGEALRSAFAQSVRTVIAPWVPDGAGSDRLTAAIVGAGGQAAFWGYEDYLPLSAAGHPAYLAAMPTKRRYRIKEDLERVADAGIAIGRVDGAELRPLIPRILQLTAQTKEKKQGSEDPAQIETVLTALLDAGADVRCYVARRKADVVGTCVAIHKNRHLYIKWAGFDYEVLGDRSGVYFGLVLHAPIRDGYAQGLLGIEFGAGAHRAKALRGCLPRAKTTAVVAADPGLSARLAPLLATFGERQRAGELGASS